MRHRTIGTGLLGLGVCVAAASHSVAAVFNELEPNDNKTQANLVNNMLAGDFIVGQSLGATGTNLDYFRVKTAPAPLGIYLYTLAITTPGTAGHTGTIRALTQSNGVITPGSDATSFIQTSAATTTPPRSNRWYGFGKQEEIYYRVTGAAGTTQYNSTLSLVSISPVNLGNFSDGQITITTVGQGHTTDTDMWVYDGNLNAIPLYGNDDEGPLGSTLQSRLTRSYSPGTYFLALSNFNVSNNQASPTGPPGNPTGDEDFDDGAVLDFPNAVNNTSTAALSNLTFSVTDSAGTAIQFPATKGAFFEIYWATFTVVHVDQPGACCLSNGQCITTISLDCGAIGGEFQGEGTACAGDNDGNGIDDRCQDQPCADCGPGPHWIHAPTPCPAGTNHIPTTAAVGVDTNNDGVADTTLNLAGPTTVQHNAASDDSNSFPGTRPVDGHVDVIDYEMTFMNLTGGGATIIAGAGLGSSPLAATLGAMAEQPGNPALADGFFDVFFELDLGGGTKLYNQTPLRINASNLDCFPPVLLGINPPGLIPLFTSPTGGTQVGNLTTATHTTFPQPGACCLPNGQCIQTPSAAQCNGEFQGSGTACAGDLNGNGIDDLCEDQPCEDAGPGPHWVDTAPAGNDNVPTGALVGIDIDLDCVRDQNLVMFGPAGISRTASLDDSGQYPGTRPIDGHSDVIDTEMLAMSLTGGGATLTAGAGLGAIPLAASLGNIAEQLGNPALADSFFDVFFEIDLGGGNRLYNQTPLRVQAVIDCVPPNRMYFHPVGICIPLYTSPTPGGGVHVANLVSANHDPFPQPGACCVDTTCIPTTSVECEGQGGQFQGEGSVCTTETCTVEACCFKDGSCAMLPAAQCIGTGGEPGGPGSLCAGDNNGNGIDDTCEDQPCADCGPGPHWIHAPQPCPAGTNHIPTTATVGVDTNNDGVADTNLNLAGPTTVAHNVASDDSNNYPGTRPVDGHIDVIDYEMTFMNLTGGGATIIAGAGLGSNPLAASLGAMAEQAGNPALADGFFDVFFELDLGGGTKLYNQTPLRINAQDLDCFPPVLLGLSPPGLIPLFTSPTGGTQVGNLTSATHTTFPQPVAACCYKDGTCAQQIPTVCISQGGEPQGAGSVCQGDLNGNGIDDLCEDQPCEDCGPGPHWIHAPAPCPAGTNHIPTTATVGVDTNNDGVADTNLNLAGPTTVQHNVASDDSNSFPGTRPVDGHIDVIDYEMTFMNLTGGGATIIAGAGLGSNPLAASLGAMAEQAGNPALADGFFDVFFELDLGGGTKLYNQTPLRINAQDLDCFPPVLLGLSPPGLIPLFTSPTGGTQVGNLTSATHTTFPQPVAACCYKDGTCAQQIPTVCISQGGEPQGAGSVCQGDLNGNGIDDLCEDQPCEDCGPGPHWIHAPAPCPAGTNHIPTTATVGVDTNNDGVADTNLNLAGPTTVQHNVASDDSNSFPGTRPVDGHIDVIDYEMTFMNLTGGGATIIAGAGLGSNPLAASLGAMAEQAGNPALADGFFDVFFELDLGGGTKLYNQTPLRINAANLDCFPPVLLGLSPPGLIPLFTSPTGGTQVGNLTNATHTTFPQPVAACCYKDGTCAQQIPTVCISQGGEPQGAGSVCQGDLNGNGIDDLCEDQPCEDCGPGPHWIHAPAPCPAGTNHIPTTATVGVDTNNDGVADTNLNLAGPTTVQHNVASDDSNSFPGTRPVDGHIDVIDYEMTFMNLTGGGATIIAGAGLGSNPLAASLGAMAEQAGNPALADGFFDVFFELDLGGGTKLYNQTPLRINAQDLDCFPPVLLGLSPPGLIPLFTSPTGGTQVGNLVNATHTTFPQPAEACCYKDGTCAQQIPTVCTAQGGEPQGAGSLCAGDNDGDGIDDLCQDDPCDDCGPGPHWIHSPVPCPPGLNFIPTTAVLGLDLNLDGVVDTNLPVSGPTTVQHNIASDDSANYPGLAPVDGHIDVIDYEMTYLSLTGGGATVTAGAGLGALPLAPSYGAMREQVGNPSLANGFFDVFFEIDLGGGNRLYNQQPLRINASDLDCFAPILLGLNPPGLLPLFTSPSGGTQVANLGPASHSTFSQGVFPASVTAAVSRKSNPHAPGLCDTNLLPPRKSEMHQGGIQEVRIDFNATPGGGGSGASLFSATCPTGTFAADGSAFTGSVAANTLVLSFVPALSNAKTYRIDIGPAITTIGGQSVFARGLVGDATGNGRVDAGDRSAVVGAWTGPGGFSCSTDINNSGQTNSGDRSAVVGAWTNPAANCAP